MTSLSSLCLDLFLLGHAHLAAGRAGRGFEFERRVRGHLGALGLPDAREFRVLDRRSLSGMYHQLDEQTDCGQALVIGEWKAWIGQIPKNELLRFKAATDDYWLATRTRLDVPVVRVFGGTGHVTKSMRTYAAQWGIVLITPDRWPVPTLCDPDLVWSAGDLESPPEVDAGAMATLVRPMGQILRPLADGGWRLSAMASDADLVSRIALWHHWSERAWRWWDDECAGRFEALMEERTGRIEAISA